MLLLMLLLMLLIHTYIGILLTVILLLIQYNILNSYTFLTCRNLARPSSDPAACNRPGHMAKKRQSVQQVADRKVAAIIAVYIGSCRQKDVKDRFAGVDPFVIGRIVKQLPAGLVDDNNQRTLSRAVNAILNNKERRPYTDFELREALFNFCRRDSTWTKSQIRVEYGVSKTTLKDGKQRLWHALGKTFHPKNGYDYKDIPTDKKLLEKLESLPCDGPGPKPYLETDENTVTVLRAQLRSEIGHGVDRRSFQVQGKQLVRGLASAGGSAKQTEKMEKAECSGNWCRNAIRRAREELPEENFSFRKGCNLSENRAEQMKPEIINSFFDMCEHMWKDHQDRGILKTDTPHPTQMMYFDELGCDPTGKICAVLTSGAQSRAFNVKKGEKAPFWVTVGLFTRADGTMPCEPTVVWEGTRINGLMRKVGPGWAVHCTPNGYMDGDGFTKSIQNLVSKLGDLRPIYIFLDGYWFHFGYIVRMLMDDGIYLVFIPSHLSHLIAVNDRAPNGHFKGTVDVVCTEVKQRRGTLGTNIGVFAGILEEATARFKVKGGVSIVKGWKVTYLYPFVRPNAEQLLEMTSAGTTMCTSKELLTTRQLEDKVSQVRRLRPHELQMVPHTAIGCQVDGTTKRVRIHKHINVY
jgi:hypothetical protein